ncbi:MAG: hypothetical protein Q7W56_01190 [Candidatus Latescibacteria bacterium]|nr:hypothetical protein [Candidatus Latescibacterota bacterium]
MRDTTPQAAALQISILRGLSGEQRLMTAIEMSDLTRELCRSRLRGQHPDCSEADLRREFLFCVYGITDLPRTRP